MRRAMRLLPSRLQPQGLQFADIQLTGNNGLRIDGLKAGETKLLVWTGEKRKAYRIVVE